MEANLSRLENKLDELLAQFEATAAAGSPDSNKGGSNADEGQEKKKET